MDTAVETIAPKIERTFRRSDSIAKLAEALAKAQGLMEGAKKDSANPFFKSKYADLASVWEAVRSPLSANGLAIIQFPRTTGGNVEVETMLCHASGEWVAETLSIPATTYIDKKDKNGAVVDTIERFDAQTVGSAITYARRYMLQAVTGNAPEDDDGNAAAKGVQDLQARFSKILHTAAEKGTQALETAWKSMSLEARRACQHELAALKAKAEKFDSGPTNGKQTPAPATREPGEEG